MAERRVKVLECDNPECVSPPSIIDGDIILGWHLKGGVFHGSGGGGPVPKTYACSDECVLPALIARHMAAWNGEA